MSTIDVKEEKRERGEWSRLMEIFFDAVSYPSHRSDARSNKWKNSGKAPYYHHHHHHIYHPI
jgi:hypothetical protein